MNMIKDNKIIVFIIGIYINAFISEIYMLFTYRNSSDYQLLNNSGLGYLFLSFLIIMVLLDGLAPWFIFKRNPIGLWLAIFVTLFKRAEEYFVLRISLNNYDLFKKLLIENRQAKGLPIDNETINHVSTQSISIYYFGFMMLFSVIIILLLLWKKDYFYDNTIQKQY